jgi:ribosomal protein S18 acetylase RimI-like enzyme
MQRRIQIHFHRGNRMTLTIRRGVPTDADIVADMNSRMALETEGKTLDPPTISAGVRAVLADPARGLYFIAENDGVIVGQTMVTLEWSDWRNGWMWWIQSVYVKAEARRQGVFRALYQHIVEAAKAAEDVVGIRLYVEEENHAAQKTYLSLGMERTRYQLLERSPL